MAVLITDMHVVIDFVNQVCHGSFDAQGVPSLEHALDVGSGALRDFLKIKSLLEQRPESARLSDKDFFGVGCLHDIVGNKRNFNGQQISFRSLLEMGFPSLWIDSLRLVTKLKDEESDPEDPESDKIKRYKKFINRITEGEMTPERLIAIMVKLADLADNMRGDRYNPKESEKIRMARRQNYEWAKEVLGARLEEFLYA